MKKQEMIVCPVCGQKMTQKAAIFHFKKKAVFEVYDWFQLTALEQANRSFSNSCPHEDYIQRNSVSEMKFKFTGEA